MIETKEGNRVKLCYFTVEDYAVLFDKQPICNDATKRRRDSAMASSGEEIFW